MIVLVYNNPEMTLNCLESIRQSSTGVNYELVVVSNGSNTATVKSLMDYKKKNKSVELVFIEQNLNFAVGNNVGFHHSKGERIVFLNNDTIVTDGWLDELVEVLDDESVVAAQPVLLYPDQTVQCAGIGFSPMNTLGHAMYAHCHRKHAKHMYMRKLQAVTAACMAVRADDFTDAKGFDPRYVNGQEDIDLCLRLMSHSKQKDAHTTCVSSVVYHDESKTPGRGRYVTQNRRAFVDRWHDKVSADAQKIYEDDGFVVKQWVAGSGAVDLMISDYEVYQPILKRR